MAVGGAAYLVSKAITSSRVVAFADLGMEAIYEFDVQGHAGHGRRRRAAARRCTRPGRASGSSGSARFRSPCVARRAGTSRPMGAAHARRDLRLPTVARRAHATRAATPSRMTPSPTPPQAPVAARGGHDLAAQPAAGADGAADQAQPADDRPDLPHRDRDHRLLRLAAVARRRQPSCARSGATALAMLAELAEYGLVTGDRANLDRDPRQPRDRRRHRLRARPRRQAQRPSSRATFAESALRTPTCPTLPRAVPAAAGNGIAVSKLDDRRPALRRAGRARSRQRRQRRRRPAALRPRIRCQPPNGADRLRAARA